ncbi:MAG: NitT/TauT family transport system substrate-binding protein [Alphaproteobacteria bacterium]|nr:NitT/TauT family transport system substrate-binding protein [Alphaproteobacteria bacterium]
MQIIQTRRCFLGGLSASGAASLCGGVSIAAEPPPETTTIRLPFIPAACTGPLFMAEDLLREEGFTDVQYVPATMVSVGMVAEGAVDLSMEAGFDYLPLMDTDLPLTLLAGIQVGCHELRANDSVKGIPDLRGKKVGINALGATEHMLVSMMASFVGLNPNTEITWVTNSEVSQVELFTAGEIDAFIGFPPDPQQPCERTEGHVVVNTANDAPWSEYFCCMATANADFVKNNPVATKRALRALLRATDICHNEKEKTAQKMVEVGFSLDCARTILNDAKYGVWRDYDPEDTVRFFTLRLHELGMIKKTPSEIISRFTDWRFLQEVKRELA